MQQFAGFAEKPERCRIAGLEVAGRDAHALADSCGTWGTDGGPATSVARVSGGCHIPESISAICRSTTDTTKRENGLR